MLTYRAHETGLAEDADRALQAIDHAELPDNPLLMTTRVSALLIAAQAAGQDSPARTAFQKQAEEVARQLDRFPDIALAVRGRCLYAYVTGDDEALLELVRQGKQSVENPGSFDEYFTFFSSCTTFFCPGLRGLVVSISRDYNGFGMFERVRCQAIESSP